MIERIRAFLARADLALFRAERALCLGLLGLMSVAVFLDVVHRLASTEGPVERLFTRVMPGSAGQVVRLVLETLLTFGLVYLALRTARVARPPGPGRAAVIAGVTTAALWAAVELLLRLAPNGLLWSQIFALCGMLWVGFLGASMATHERAHLTLEIMEFVWKGKAKVHVGRVGAGVAAAFCVLLAYLSLLHVQFHHETWVESDGIAGTFDPFPVPKFVVFAILPLSFTVMALRFLGRVFSQEEEEPPPTLEPLRPGGDEPPDAAGAEAAR